MISDRIRWHEVLLPINKNHNNFRKKILGQTPPVGTMPKAKNLEISQFFFQGKWLLLWLLWSILWLVNFAEWTSYDWLLQLSDHRCPITANCPVTRSNYTCSEWLVKYKAADATWGDFFSNAFSILRRRTLTESIFFANTVLFYHTHSSSKLVKSLKTCLESFLIPLFCSHLIKRITRQ